MISGKKSRGREHKRWRGNEYEWSGIHLCRFRKCVKMNKVCEEEQKTCEIIIWKHSWKQKQERKLKEMKPYLVKGEVAQDLILFNVFFSSRIVILRDVSPTFSGKILMSCLVHIVAKIKINK